MKATKKSKLHEKVRQVNQSNRLHTLWHVNCKSDSVNLFSLTCKLFHGSKISHNEKNNIILDTANNNTMLDHRIKMRDVWIA